jgi:hypothetical protein
LARRGRRRPRDDGAEGGAMSQTRRRLGRLAAALVAAVALAIAAPALGAPPTVTKATPTGTVRVVDVDIVVTFNMAVTPASMQAPGAFVVQEITTAGPGPAIADTSVAPIVNTGGRSWRLTLPSAAGSSATYKASLSNITSASAGGGTLNSYTWTFSTSPDGIPPRALTSLAAAAAPGGVALAWDGPPDLDRAGVTILRREGAQVPSPLDPATTVVASVPSPGATALDTTALPGHTYTYAALPYDRDTPPNQGPLTVAPSPVSVPAAPPTSTATGPDAPVTTSPPTVPVTSTPTTPKAPAKSKLTPARLLLPATKTKLIAGRKISLRWRANPKAAYYNVQVFRGRRKILTTFPTGVREVIPARLLTTPGSYRLLVWSGLGAKRRGRYAPTPWLIKTLQVRPRVPTAAEAR